MRLINAGDAYIVLVDEYHLRSVAQSYALMEALDKVPTVDAVPVIRCKDCKYFTRDSITGVTIPGTEYCIFTMNNRIEENDFCSRAERRNDDATD